VNTCRCGCGRPATGRLGFAEPCRQRWNRAGRPADFGPPRWTNCEDDRDDRIEDYVFIGGPNLTTAEAAKRLGLCQRTINRFNAILREREHCQASLREMEAA
jgi:hypothetical protein